MTVLPRTRSEDGWFRKWAQTHTPTWTEASRRPGKRLGDPDRVHSTFTSPLPSSEGHRIIWVLSSAKTAIDAAARQGRIEAGAAAIDALAIRLAGPKTRLKTRVAIEEAAADALKATARPGGSTSPSPRPSKRTSAKNAAAGPALTPATARPPAPGTTSAGKPTPRPSATTPSPTGCSLSSATIVNSMTPRS